MRCPDRIFWARLDVEPGVRPRDVGGCSRSRRLVTTTVDGIVGSPRSRTLPPTAGAIVARPWACAPRTARRRGAGLRECPRRRRRRCGNVRIVSCVQGAPIDCAAMIPTESPILREAAGGSERQVQFGRRQWAPRTSPPSATGGTVTTLPWQWSSCQTRRCPTSPRGSSRRTSATIYAARAWSRCGCGDPTDQVVVARQVSSSRRGFEDDPSLDTGISMNC